MKNFLKYVLATITGIIIVSILFMVVMLASLSVMMVSGDKTTSITDNSVLVLKAGVNIPDKGSKNPYSGIDIINMTVTPAPGLNEILQNLKKAASDDKVKGVLIENGMIPPGWATTEELRDGLKNSGRREIRASWSDYLMIQEGYYLSARDKIYINQSSAVDFKGLSGEILFYKKISKLGVEFR